MHWCVLRTREFDRLAISHYLQQDRYLLLRQDRCLLLRQDRCLLLRQDRCIVPSCSYLSVNPGIIPELSENYLGITPELSRNYPGIISRIVVVLYRKHIVHGEAGYLRNYLGIIPELSRNYLGIIVAGWCHKLLIEASPLPRKGQDYGS